MLQTASYTDKGGRIYNEDASSLFSSPNGQGLCAILADGLGSHGGGDRAAAMVCETLKRDWKGSVSAAELQQLIQEAHHRICRIQTSDCSMKSTAVVLLLNRDKVAWAHVGDSRLYHFINGKLIFQTQDHSASQVAVLLGDITQDQIRFHPDRNRVLRALGQDGDLTVSAEETALCPGNHAFLLCSDGFWEYVLEQEMAETLAKAKNPEEWIIMMRYILSQRIPADNDNNTAAAVWLSV